MTGSFRRACRGDAVVENGAIGASAGGWPVLVARAGGRLYAVIDRCTHATFALSPGRIRGGAVICPLHGARFDLSTGGCVGGTYKPLMTFEVRENDDGWIEVKVPDEAPGLDHTPIRAHR